MWIERYEKEQKEKKQKIITNPAAKAEVELDKAKNIVNRMKIGNE